MKGTKIQLCWGWLAVFMLGLCGCSSPTGSYQSFAQYDRPMLGELETRSMNYEGPARNPVIVVHGFLGSKLADNKDGNIIWGAFKGISNFFSASPEKIRSFAVPMAIGKSLKELKCESEPVGILDDVKVRMLGFNFEISGYSKLLHILQAGGYVLEADKLPVGKNFPSLFVYYYDWRRDLPENAARLHQFVLEKRKMLQKRYKQLYGTDNYDIQFDLIAHSMGGLVSRYYLRYGDSDLPKDGSLPELTWKGSRYIDKLMIVGTPNCGYLDTVLEMVNGLQVETGTPRIAPGIIGTFPTYYQMMPQTSTRSVVVAGEKEKKSVDIFDPNVWIKYQWGLADPRQDNVLKILLPNAKSPEERRKIALDHLTKCLKRAKQFIRAVQVDASPPSDVALFLFQGDSVPTTRQAEVDPKSGALRVTVLEPGDGKVLVTSTLDDLRVGQKDWVPFLVCPIDWTAVYRINAAHMGITSDPIFANNMLFCLMILPTEATLENRKKLEGDYEKNIGF